MRRTASNRRATGRRGRLNLNRPTKESALNHFLIKDFEGLLRVVLSAVLTYATVVVFIRVAGKRTTSRMNNFDWIVTVAIGSIVASTIVLKDLPVLEGLLAVVTLLVSQFVVTKLSVYAQSFATVLHASPTLLYFKGTFLSEAMKKERITKAEVLAAVREAGIDRMENVAAVVLESDAKLSVVSAGNSPLSFDSEIMESVQYSDRTAGHQENTD